MRTIVPVLACFSLAGCLEFREPLGPVGESFIDSRLIGAWSCVSKDDPTPGVLTILDFDGKQYFMQLTHPEDSEPGRLRAHATRVGEANFLNAIAVGGEQRKPDWNLLEYRFVEAGLRLRLVSPASFDDDVRESGARVRERLEQHLDDPEVLIDLLTCTRAPSTDAVDAPD
jgi:hypothetical protein